jgi:hypothetical protein
MSSFSTIEAHGSTWALTDQLRWTYWMQKILNVYLPQYAFRPCGWVRYNILMRRKLQTRRKVYKATLESIKQADISQDVPLKYRTGQLKVATVRLRRIAFNREIYDTLRNPGMSTLYM